MKNSNSSPENNSIITTPGATINNEFASDVLKGLAQHPKQLLSKYFYDARGSKLFQQIMELPEYYLTRTETEIFEKQQKEIIFSLNIAPKEPLTIVDLGAGDAAKSKILLKQLMAQGGNFKYTPVDISADAMEELKANLTLEMPNLQVKPLASEYFEALQWLEAHDTGKKVVFFLGSNIGNFETKAIESFARKLRQFLKSGDQLLMGLDLQKDPHVIRQAYDDAAKVTAEFNYNLLHRINQEFGGNLIIANFQHFAEYNPVSGDMKSYLISTKAQEITLSRLDYTFQLKPWEPIHTETSHKFSQDEIKLLAQIAGFTINDIFTDEKQYFADVLFGIA